MVSQALTLYTTPVIYLYMDRLHTLVKRRKGAHAMIGDIIPPAEPAKGPSQP